MITGKTRVFCIIADPVGQVRTPEMFNALLSKRGIDGVLVPFHVAAEGLPAVLGGLRQIENLGGIIVTIPHKIAIMRYCDQLETNAELVGAVNVVRREADGRLIGGNFDGRGFVGSLKDAIGPINGSSAYIAGCGGAGRSIAFALAEAGVAKLRIYNRTAAKARELAGAVKRVFPEIDAGDATRTPSGADIAINATPLGMRPEDPLPFNVERINPSTVVAEVIMKPAVTPLLEAARARGCRTVTGDRMLRFQVAALADFVGVR